MVGDKGVVWKVVGAAAYMNVGDGIVYPRGVFYYGPDRMGTDEAEKVRQLDLAAKGIKVKREHEPIERFLSGPWKADLDSMLAELDALNKALPPTYPFLLAVAESKTAQ